MGVGRIIHTATLITTGDGSSQVLVVGGNQKDQTQILSSAEMYDPATDNWRPAGDMNQPRTGHTTVALANGTVLVAGGQSTTCATQASTCTKKTAELFDPSLTTWTALPEMDAYRTDHTAALLQDGRVLLVGGTGVSASAGPGENGGYLSSADVYQS